MPPDRVLALCVLVLAGFPRWTADVAEPARPEPRVHLVGPVAVAAAGLLPLILNAWLQVPVTQAAGVAAVVMAASLLPPIEALDGASTKGAAAALPAGLILAGIALLLGL